MKKYYNKKRFKRNLLTLATLVICVGTLVIVKNTDTASSTDELTDITETSVVNTDNIKLNAGAAEVLESELSEETKQMIEIYNQQLKTQSKREKIADESYIIRCTGYSDHGYTRSGEWTREGIVAGKEEWLGRTVRLYKVNDDNTRGELIGEYVFLDTGYGIDGSLVDGTSIDVWHPSDEDVWDWMSEYGDYVYMEMVY